MKYLAALLAILLLVPACSSFKIKRKSIYESYIATQNMYGQQCTPTMLEKVWTALNTRYYKKIKPQWLFKQAVMGMLKKGSFPMFRPEYLNRKKFTVIIGPGVLWHGIDGAAEVFGKTRSELCFAAIDGMVDNLDQWTKFIRPADVRKNLEHSYSEKFGGAGITMVYHNRKKPSFRAFVDNVLKDSPAEAAGIKRFDEMIIVNGQYMTKLGGTGLISALRGKVGTRLEILVKRQGKYKWFRMKRAKVDYRSAWCRLDSKRRVYCKLHGFNGNTSAQLEEALENLPSHKKEIIMDFRNNPGGLIFAATHIAAKFWLGQKRLATFEARQVGFGAFIDTSVVKEPILKRYKTIFLTNKNTASASEMLLIAIKDHKAAILLGERTYGKGVGQSVFLIEGAMLKVTSLWSISPNGTYLDKKGVAPHIYSKLTLEQFSAGNDTQLKAAHRFFDRWK